MRPGRLASSERPRCPRPPCGRIGVPTPVSENSAERARSVRHALPMDVATLFRAVGQPELDLIEASGWRRFPPRLDWQPIFYPVLTEDYAIQIARDWNTKDSSNGSVGYVTRFAVQSSFLADYPVREVGGRDLREYWIPVEDLDSFNQHIVGRIEVIGEWRGDPPRRVR